MSKPILVSQDTSTMPELASIRQMVTPCYQCGFCTATCPYPLLGHRLNIRKFVRALQLSMLDALEQAWLCSTCKLCESKCPRGVPITDAFVKTRRLLALSKKTPEKLEQVLWNVYENGNSWGVKSTEKLSWAKGLEVKDASKGVKYLLYVGCAVPYDPRLYKVARSLVNVLGAAGLDFGVLGKEEKCCGDPVYHAGELEFFEEIVNENAEKFRRTGAEFVVTISPHCYNTFKNLYPSYGADLNVLHYTQLLEQLLDGGKIHPSRKLDGRVTYHDPCYLARYDNVVEPPRKVLESIPGIEFVEMRDSAQDTLCCGGGGGRMWLESEGGRPSDMRVSQASEVEAGLMVTSCPYCIQNFEDSVRRLRLGKPLQVFDLAELVDRALG
ncbi:MAG: (Fe-S)-binding protein [Nitrososphaerota archaeon]